MCASSRIRELTALHCILQFLPARMCTLNLHLAQHIASQARWRGPPAKDGEYWVERAIQRAKAPTKSRVSRAPEATLVRRLLDNEAVTARACEPHMKDFDAWCPGFRSKELNGAAYDQLSEGSSCQLLHCGRQLSRSDAVSSLAAVRELADSGSCNGWAADDVAVERMKLYTAAQNAEADVLHSLRHTRSTRCTRFVTVMRPMPRAGRQQRHMAEILYFLRVRHADPAKQPLRLAICKLFAAQPAQGCMQVAKPSSVQATHYAVDVGVLGGALVTAAPVGQDRLYGMPYFNQSRLQ